MKNSLKITGFMLIILLSGSMSVNAQYGGTRGGGYGSMGYVTPPLTEKQKTDITAMADKYRVEMDTLRSQLRRSTDIKKRGDLASKIQILSDTHKSDVQNVLTPEQKISLETVNNMFNGRRGYGMMPGNPSGMSQSRGSMPGRGMMESPMKRGSSNGSSFDRGNSNRSGNMGGRR